MTNRMKEIVAAFNAFEANPKTKALSCPDCGAEALVVWLQRDDNDPELVIGKSLHCDNCGLFAPAKITPERIPQEG